MKRRDLLICVLVTATTVSVRAEQKAKVFRLAVVDLIYRSPTPQRPQGYLTTEAFSSRFDSWDLSTEEIWRSSDIPVKDAPNVLMTWLRRWSSSNQT